MIIWRLLGRARRNTWLAAAEPANPLQSGGRTLVLLELSGGGSVTRCAGCSGMPGIIGSTGWLRASA
jgi:hypothetical protein